jgi:hypothetical protein
MLVNEFLDLPLLQMYRWLVFVLRGTYTVANMREFPKRKIADLNLSCDERAEDNNETDTY